jgi:hypothetical protein
MNKRQKLKRLRAIKQKQRQNRELNRALDIIKEAANNRTPEYIEDVCGNVSTRILTILAKSQVELPEGLNLDNMVYEVANKEILKRANAEK